MSETTMSVGSVSFANTSPSSPFTRQRPLPLLLVPPRRPVSLRLHPAAWHPPPSLHLLWHPPPSLRLR